MRIPTRMISLPSVIDGARAAQAAALRFPFVLLAAAIAAVAAIIAIHDGSDEIERLIFSAGLGLSLLFAIAVTSERWHLPRPWRVALPLAACAFLTWLQFAAEDWSAVLTTTRYMQIAVATHLLVAVAPFVHRGSLRGFWQFNRILFLRFLLATLYAVVLFNGLALALLAIDRLFGVDVDGDAYTTLLALIGLVFHPWFFLAGVPRNLDALDDLDEYPVGLKVFSQFVLIPLATTYLLILTAYLVRVVVTTTWPSGWIGYLVSGVAAVGTLALLLVHPLRTRPDSLWVDTYARWFYVLLLPSIAMLLIAIGQRVAQYGVTEQRYFLLVLALWLAGTALFYGFTGSRNIRIIPISLCALAVVTFAGPWSAYAVSARSQLHRLEALLESNGILQAGVLTPATAPVERADQREISATVRYLVATHGTEVLAQLHPEIQPDTSVRNFARSRDDNAATGQAAAVPESVAHYDNPEAASIVRALGLTYLNQWESEISPRGDIFVHWPEAAALDVSGYNTLHRLNVVSTDSVAVAAGAITLFLHTNGILDVASGGGLIGRVRLDSLLAGMPAYARISRGPANASPPNGTFDLENDSMRVRILLRQINGEEPAGMPLNLHSVQMDMLIDVR